MLAWTIYISFLGAAVLLLLPKRAASAARCFALFVATSGCGIALSAFLRHRTGELFTILDTPWITSLGIHYHLAADGISLCLVLLTGIVAIAGVLFSWDIEDRTN